MASMSSYNVIPIVRACFDIEFQFINAEVKTEYHHFAT